jgi:hypothetical protein
MTFHAVMLAKRGAFTKFSFKHSQSVGFENLPYFSDPVLNIFSGHFLMSLKNKV